MKKFSAILGLALLVMIFVICNYFEHNYTRECEVVEMNNDSVIVLDNTGNEWEFFSDDKFEIGEKVRVRFNDNCTDSHIYDDKITGVEKF